MQLIKAIKYFLTQLYNKTILIANHLKIETI